MSPRNRSRIILPLLSLPLMLAGCGVRAGIGAAVPERAPMVKVAAIQCSSDIGATDENCRKLTRLVREAADAGAKIIVLPETAITGYISQDLRTNWHLPGRPRRPPTCPRRGT